MAFDDIMAVGVRTARYATLANVYKKVTIGREM